MIGNKKIYLEIMRIFVIFFVIYNHTLAYTLYSYDVGETFKWYIHVGMSIFCRMAVPVFWMIFGVYDTWLFRKIYKIISQLALWRTLKEIIFVIMIMMSNYLLIFCLRKIQALKILL